MENISVNAVVYALYYTELRKYMNDLYRWILDLSDSHLGLSIQVSRLQDDSQQHLRSNTVVRIVAHFDNENTSTQSMI